MGRGPVCYYVDFVSYKPDESFDLVNSRSLLGDWRYYRCWRELFPIYCCPYTGHTAPPKWVTGEVGVLWLTEILYFSWVLGQTFLVSPLIDACVLFSSGSLFKRGHSCQENVLPHVDLTYATVHSHLADRENLVSPLLLSRLSPPVISLFLKSTVDRRTLPFLFKVHSEVLIYNEGCPKEDYETKYGKYKFMCPQRSVIATFVLSSVARLC